MRASTKWLGTACAALAVVSILLWRGREHERSRADALELRLAALSQAGNRETRQALEELLPPGDEVTAPPVRHTARDLPDADNSSAAHDAERETERELLRDPKYAAAWRSERQLVRAEKLAEYRRLGLELSPDEGEKLVDYWIELDLEELTATRLPNPGTEAERRAFSEYYEKRQRERDEALRVALGDEALGKYREFMTSRPTRNQVMSLGAQLGAGANALREQQFEPLVGVMNTERARLDRQLVEYLEGGDPGGEPTEAAMQRSHEHITELVAASDQRVHENAASILSPSQLAVLDAMLERERELQRARRDVYRLRMQAQPGEAN